MTNATNTPAIGVFIEQLLAPLPEGEEPADTKAFRKRIERDMLMAWSKAMEHVEVAQAHHTIAAIKMRNDPSMLAYDTIDTWPALLEAERRQCLVPAPTMTQLRWKKRLLDQVKNDPEVAAAIKADEVRLQGGNDG